MIEYYGADGASMVYSTFDHEFIEKLLKQTYELRRDPKERERERAEEAAEKTLKRLGGLVEIGGRKFNTEKGVFED